MGQLDGKVSIITGGGTGIGKGIARAFAREGSQLVLASRNQSNLEKTAEEFRSAGASVLVVPTDVTVEDQVGALFRKTVEEFGRVDILVNNAAVFDGGPVDEMSLEAWQRAVDVNLTGPFLCTRDAMKIMKRQKGGRIINIGSISAQMPRENSVAYTATKHAIVGLTRATALDGRPFGIAVSCLHPGNVDVERRQGGDAEIDQEPMMGTEEIAKVALTMAALHPDVNMLEAVVLPVQQLYVGRG